MYKVVYENDEPVLKKVELTKEEAVKLHREMWNWIANEIYQRKKVCEIWDLKHEYLKYNNYSNIRSHCFCCEYVAQSEKAECSKLCPFNWARHRNFVYCVDGYYLKCENASDWISQYKLAIKIANLPVRTNI